ncbi:aldehyde dehydrogenase family protein [Microbacterium sp. NPDC056044]|uniref:aldehyde dehydrogenase family protein n=1 Tax=Microbacterium sp. NPDC056044 TaxID=3345690 RepID=UPI0035E17A7B
MENDKNRPRAAPSTSVIATANDTEWGLVGYVIALNAERAARVSAALEVGMVVLNTGIVSGVAAPSAASSSPTRAGMRTPRHRRVPELQIHCDSRIPIGVTVHLSHTAGAC